MAAASADPLTSEVNPGQSAPSRAVSEPAPPRRWVGGLCLGALGALGWWCSTAEGKRAVRQGLEATVGYVESQGDAAVLFYMGFTVVGVICLVPTTLMEFSGGFLFAARYGLMTTWFLTCISKLVANVISVWLARHLLKDWVRKVLVDRSELLTLVAEAVKEEPFKMAFLVRGSMAPLSVKNYGLGVLDIGYVPIACASCIFTPFYALQNLYMGSVCQSLQEVFAPRKPGAGPGSWAETAKAVVPIAFNVLLAIFLVKAVKAQLKKSKAGVEASLRARSEHKKD